MRLVMDTASKFLYFCFIDKNNVIHEEYHEGKNNHSDNLLKKIENALVEKNLKLNNFSEILVGIGPGSYTGLRVSVTVAKILAWTLNIPLYKVSSLDLLSSGYYSKDGIYATTIRAKKNHVYGKLFEVVDGKINILLNDVFLEDDIFFDKIKGYKYTLINEENYKINSEKLIVEKVENIHTLTPNYIQKEI